MTRYTKVLIPLLVAGLAGCGAGDSDPAPLEGADLPVPARLDKMDPDLRGLIDQRLQAVRDEPADAARWVQLGLAYESHELFAPALECYAHAVASNPKEARWQYHLAQMQRETGRVDEALETYATVARLAPDYVPAHWQQGFLLLEQGRVDDAERAFLDAEDVGPSEAAAAGLARVAFARKQPEAAAEALQPYLSAGTAQAYLHHLAGLAYRQLGRMDLAETALILGKDSRPRWRDPWADEALLNRVVHYTRLEEARAWFEAGRSTQALPTLEALAAKKPDDRRTLSTLGRAYLLAGQDEKGMATLRKMAGLYSDHFEAHLDLATAYEHFEDLPRALEHAERSIEINPNFSASHRRRGIILVKLGKADQGSEALERAVALAPDSLPAWRALGECRLILSDWEAAARAFERVVHLEPDRADSYSRLGLALLRAGDRDGANAAFASAQKLAPARPR